MASRPLTRPYSTPQFIVAVTMTALALASAFGAISLAGTKTGVALAALAVLGPIAAYLALVAPMIFPFCVFILLVPFDNLLGMSAFGTITRLGAIVSGAAIVLWLLRTRQVALPGRTMLWWGAFLMWSVVSLMWAIDPTIAGPELATLLQLFGLYVGASLMPMNAKTLGILIAVVIASGAVAGAYGAYVFHSGADVTAGGRLVLATDDSKIDPNKFAAALVVPFALALVAFVSTKGIVRALSVCAVAALGAGVAISGSRGGLLAIVAAFAYLIAVHPKRLLLAGIGVCGLGGALALYGNILARFSTAGSSGGAGRYDIWKVGIAAFRQHPLFGSGFSNFSLAFDRSYLSVSQTYYTNWHRAPHSILISTAVELGIVGLAIFLGAWWVQFRSLKFIPKGHSLHWVRLGLEASVLGLFVSGLFLDIVTTKFFWLAFIMMALARNAALATRRVPREIDVSAVLPAYAQRGGN